MKHASKGVPLMLVFGAISGIFLTFLCSLLFRMRPVSNRAVSGASPSVPTPAVALPQALATEYRIEDGMLFDASGALLLSDLKQAGLEANLCGEVEGLHFFAVLGGKGIFFEACGETGGKMWQYDPMTRRFSPRAVRFGFGQAKESPDKRYQVDLPRDGREVRRYVLKDFLLDTETSIAPLPSRWSYVQASSEFDGAPLGLARWEGENLYLSVFDAGIPFDGLSVSRSPLFEKRVTVSASQSSAPIEAGRLIGGDELYVRNGKMYRGVHRQLLSADVRQAGLILSECGNEDLSQYAEIESKIFFTESCAASQLGGRLWMYDGSTLRFTARKLVVGAWEVARSPDGRYRLGLVEREGETESRLLVVRDLLRDMEERVAPLPVHQTYAASVSEFFGSPLGKARWENGGFVVSIFDASTPVPFAGDEGQARPVLRERKVALPW